MQETEHERFNNNNLGDLLASIQYSNALLEQYLFRADLTISDKSYWVFCQHFLICY